MTNTQSGQDAQNIENLEFSLSQLALLEKVGLVTKSSSAGSSSSSHSLSASFSSPCRNSLPGGKS
jgi:hypothetical protein